MYDFARQLLRRFSQDEGGNVFILFGATAIPLMLVMGGAVDVTRYLRYKAELSNALDAAVLALAREHSAYTEEQADTFVTDYVNAFDTGDSEFSVEDFAVEKLSNGFRVTATGAMQTMFLPLGEFTRGGHGLNEMPVNIISEVVNASNRLEVVLVFDNTGSMNCGNTQTGNCVDQWSNPGTSSRIYNLKQAAHTLVDTLMPDGGEYDHVKIAMVPFEGAVNIGSTYTTTPPSWVDWASSNDGKAKYNGKNLQLLSNFTNWTTCTTPGGSCKYVGHKLLFNHLTQANSTVKWEGCVEMRAEPYDILNTTPTTSTPDTLFVPYFWPDEPDHNATNQYTTSPNTRYNDVPNTSNTASPYEYQNNYLADKSAVTANASRPANAQKFLAKYRYTNSSTKAIWHSGKLALATSFPYQAGPNWGCPRPIVPLTNTKSTVESAIDNMIAYYSTGTYIPAGLVWGWHVLTPNEPFTQGITTSDPYYDQTVRAIVLFTDGENFITSENNHNYSRYSGYNYTGLSVSGTYRLGSSNVSTAVANMKTKTATLCTNVKTNSTAGNADDDIRLYTITFGSMSTADEDLMENCATNDPEDGPLYHHAPTTSSLENIFREIGEDLSDIHLSM